MTAIRHSWPGRRSGASKNNTPLGLLDLRHPSGGWNMRPFAGGGSAGGPASGAGAWPGPPQPSTVSAPASTTTTRFIGPPVAERIHATTAPRDPRPPVNRGRVGHFGRRGSPGPWGDRRGSVADHDPAPLARHATWPE